MRSRGRANKKRSPVTREAPRAHKSRSLDLFLLCSLTLTAVIAAFAFTLHSRKAEAAADLRQGLADLDKLRELASDTTFREHIARYREGRPQEGEAVDFETLMVNLANKHGLTIALRTRPFPGYRSRRDGLEEAAFDLVFHHVELEALTHFLFALEEGWIGARVESYDAQWNARSEDWKAKVRLLIFRNKSNSSSAGQGKL